MRGGGGVVLVGLGRNHDGAAVQGQVHHLGPDAGVDVLVDAEHPRRAGEQAARLPRVQPECAVPAIGWPPT